MGERGKEGTGGGRGGRKLRDEGKARGGEGELVPPT